MKASEIKLKKMGYTMLHVQEKEREHTYNLMMMGRLIPTTKAQSLRVAKLGIFPDVMNMDDVELIEKTMNEFGFQGDYRYTKSKLWVRLVNAGDWFEALKMKYNN